MARAAESSIAVIVPVLNEAPRITALVAHLRSIGAHEIIIVDGGSADGTRDLVAAHPDVRLVDSVRGRGSQIAAGLAATTADVVVILHADTTLPADARAHISATLADPGVAGGAFRLRFDDSRWPLRVYAWMTRFETLLTTFGDQAMFARRAALIAAGGVPSWPLLEDIETRRRLRRVGRFVKLAAAVETSARRFQRVGVFRAQVRNCIVIAGYLLKVSPARLARFYGAELK